MAWVSISEKGRLVQALVMLALGAVAALGQPPQHLWPLTLIAFAALFASVKQVGHWRQGAGWLWAFGTGYFAVALRWIIEPFFIEPEIHGWMAPFAIVLMAGGLALFWAAAGAVAIWFRGPARVWALVLALGLAELARAYVLTGFPWAGVAQTLLGSPFDIWLSVVGPHGAGTLILALAGAIVMVFARTWTAALAAVALASAVHVAALQTPAEAENAAPLVRIVQPNAPQREKWDPDKAPVFFWRQVDATAAEGAPDLVVWPETAVPGLLHNNQEALAIVGEAAAGAPVVLGMQRADGFRFFNALIAVGPGGLLLQTYDKHHLVPFGEYMPFPTLFRNIGIRALAQRADSGYAAGAGPRLVDLPGIGAALPLICYEAVFPQHARAPGTRPRLLLQITNDAWFGTYAGPQQHLAQARMRAIEQGLPLVRSANTGISAVIDARGLVLASLPLGVHGHVDATLPPALMPTIYARLGGDWPVGLVMALGLAGLALRRRFAD